MTSRSIVARLGLAAACGAMVLVAACGSSSKSSTSSSSAAGSGTGGSGAEASITIGAASVPGVGTVLVNGTGRTLYVLSSEKGGKVTCTDANGCTQVWPDTELPAGMTKAIAGSGVQASLLGTAEGADGKRYVTYASYPLYEFSGDSGPGTAKGEGIASFGGTWTVMSPGGAPVAAHVMGETTTTAGGSTYNY